MDDLRFSVLIATYEGDDPDDLARAIRSVIDQTVQPDEVLVVADGPLTTELDGVLSNLRDEYPERLRLTALSENQGLGAALNHGVEACAHEWIARMDSDDIAAEDRFEKQLEYIKKYPETDVIGGYIAEFAERPDKVYQVREVPLTHEDIKKRGRFRCPINHPSVMYRRQAVIDAGNYRKYRSMQDYELWMRMISKGYTFGNLPEVLVKCHAGEELYIRRGGVEYAQTEFEVQSELFRQGVVSFPVFIFNLGTHLPVRVLPPRIRGFIYKYFLRD